MSCVMCENGDNLCKYCDPDVPIEGDPNMIIYQPFDGKGKKYKDFPDATPAEHAERIGVFRRVLANKQYEVVKWRGYDGKAQQVLVDGQTANAVCTVYDAISPASRDIFVKMEIDKMGLMAWKSVK